MGALVGIVGRHRLTIFLTYAVLWAVSAGALAQALLPVPVQLSTGDDYPPFSMKSDPDGGAATSLVKAVFAELKLPLLLEIEPWARGRMRATAGQIDATFPYVPTPERLQQFFYSRPLAAIKIRLFALQGAPLATLPLALVSGQTLCIGRGTVPAAPSRRLLENRQVTHVEGSDVTTCLKLLLARRVDIVQTHEQIASRILRQFEVPPESIQAIGGDDPLSFEETGLHLIVSRSLLHGAELTETFDKGLAVLRENGRFSEILSRYGLTLPSN